MKTITTTAAAILALAPLGAQAAGIALPAPAAITAPAKADAQPVLFDLAQVEGDLMRLLNGNGGDSSNRGDRSSRHGNGGDSNGGNSSSGNSNGGDSNGGNSGNSGNGGDS